MQCKSSCSKAHGQTLDEPASRADVNCTDRKVPISHGAATFRQFPSSVQLLATSFGPSWGNRQVVPARAIKPCNQGCCEGSFAVLFRSAGRITSTSHGKPLAGFEAPRLTALLRCLERLTWTDDFPAEGPKGSTSTSLLAYPSQQCSMAHNAAAMDTVCPLNPLGILNQTGCPGQAVCACQGRPRGDGSAGAML